MRWISRCWRKIGKRASEVLLVAGLGGVAGCGVGSTALRASGPGDSGGLILTDTMTQMHFNLSVADGSPTLTEMGSSATATAEPGLIDSATGEHFWLGVADGALTLGPGLSATGVNASEGVAQIGLTDTVTAKTYELAVVSGGLTLTSN